MTLEERGFRPHPILSQPAGLPRAPDEALSQHQVTPLIISMPLHELSQAAAK